jgi:hypothetical protein
VLAPLGGGRDFRWEGYDDAWVDIGGRRMPSVPGGTHWGAGVSISARDQGAHRPAAARRRRARGTPAHSARVGRSHVATLRDRPFYGRLTVAQPGRPPLRRRFALEHVHDGRGGNTGVVDPEHDAVIVSRWLDGSHATGFVRLVAEALASA